MIVDKELIAKAKKKLGNRTAEVGVSFLGINNWDEKNLKGCCPYHNENTPSFIYNPKTYQFHCFGCNKTVDIVDVFMSKGNTFIQAVEKLFDLTGTEYAFSEKNIKLTSYNYPKEVPVNDKKSVYDYWSKRGISKATLDYCDVREDNNGNTVFNYYNTNDVLTMVKYRPSRKIDKSKGDIKCWCQKGADTKPLLFNMNRINISSPLLLTEGEADTLAAIESGFINAVSVPLGSGNLHWIEENWEWLEQFDNIIVCSDNDEAGLKMRKEVIYRLGGWRCKCVNIPTYKKIDNKKVRIKDLNEVLYYFGKEKVLDLILNAVDTPIESVSDYSDITNVDLDQIDGILTGFNSLDKSLMKLFNGTFNIVTGINGSGKSSFLSQLICQSLEQNKNVWMYSGELPNFQTKNWINYILAGQRNVKQKNYNNTPFWKVTDEAQRKMNAYYRGKLFIYNDGYSHKVDDLINSAVETIRKFGAKLIVVDNLTSVNLGCNENNKYQKQEEFVNRLIDMAKNYNVVVILVVHPHKIEAMRRLTKMDVQGISAIVDLAHRIISLYRVQPSDKQGIPKKNGGGWYKEPIKHDVLIDILKDRMLGFEGSSVGMYYDRPSRRFFADDVDLDYKYSWDKNEYKDGLPFYPPQLLKAEEEREVFG